MGHENLLIISGHMIKLYTMIKWDIKIQCDTRDMKGTKKNRLYIIMYKMGHEGHEKYTWDKNGT